MSREPIQHGGWTRPHTVASHLEGLTPAETKEHTEEYALYLLGVECNRVADNLELLSEADYNRLKERLYAREAELYGEDKF